ncbi:MAG: aldo/keto reductase, partial [Acidimicrobiaceae bacterium]|nr:aldo/keto reductase [Acidimicrobiaceae bacterium]
ALGAALTRLDAHDAAVVLTKIQLRPDDLANIETAVLAAGEASRRRLGREVIDVLLLHNRVGPRDGPPGGLPPLTVKEAVDQVAVAFERLRRDGLIRAYGFSSFHAAPGPLREVLEHAHADLINASFNALNPSAGHPVAPVPLSDPRFDASDYGGLIDAAAACGAGTIVIQPLAGGLLGRSEGPPLVERLRSLAKRRGLSLLELAAGFSLAKEGVVSLGWGFRSPAQMASAAAAVERPPLDPETVGAVLAEALAGG